MGIGYWVLGIRAIGNGQWRGSQKLTGRDVVRRASCVVGCGLWAVGCGQVARVPQESSGVTEEELLGICLDLSEVSQAEDE